MQGDRLLPAAVGFSGSALLGMTFNDVNWTAIGGGITAIGLGIGAGWWQIANTRIRAFRETEAAKLEAYKASEAAKLDVEMRRLQVQRGQAAIDRESLTPKLVGMQESLNGITGQLAAAQQLASDRQAVVDSMKDVVDGLKQRLEDANHKLHTVVNDENARHLRHELEKAELRTELEARYAILMKQFGEIREQNTVLHAENARLVLRVNDKVETNTAAIREIRTEATP